MEKKGSISELQRLIEAINSSEVLEGRTELLAKLRDLQLYESSDLASLVECLTVSEWAVWEDFTCLDVSQCILNKTILHVAAKYLESDISRCFAQFLLLGTKASIWCGKHLKMTVMSTGDSQEGEEHCNLFFQLLLDNLKFSAASVSALIRYYVFGDEASMIVVRNFIFEQLNLTRDSISEIKKINSVGGEVLKAAQGIIEAIIRLCKEYLQAMNSDSFDAGNEKDINSKRFMNHIVNITMITIEKLCELGILAANDGGSLVTILNVSWKGVITLLQLGKGKIALEAKVADIIAALISLVNGSLKSAAVAWSSSLEDNVSAAEARRTFLPVKFYLINVVKVSSLYACQAYLVYRDLAHCVLMISAFKLSLSHEKLLRNAGEVIAELLEKISLDLLFSLLNSAEVKQDLKYELLDWLFVDDCCSDSVHGDSVSNYRETSMDEIFSVPCEAMPRAKKLLHGRVALFISFLRYSSDLEEDVNLLISRKLGWILEMLIDEEVYLVILVSQIPVLYISGKTVELVWEPMFSTLLVAMKTFMVVASSTLAWGAFESFLLDNVLHPHFLCWEIIAELWCFLVRHAEMELVNDIIDKFCALMRLVASSESVLSLGATLRKMARSLCMLIKFGTPLVADRVYTCVTGDDRSQLSSALYVALLMEGFPMNMLSDNVRSTAKEKIVTDYFDFIDSFDYKSLDVSSLAFGVPVSALSASSQSLQVSITDVDMKTLKFLVAIVRGYKNSLDKLTKGILCKLLNETLGIISNMSTLYESDEIEEVIFELENLFMRHAASDSLLQQCKPNLALFMAGLSHMRMSESDNCAKSSAVWGLYHMLLREKHWAFVHLAVTSFGYFAARTNCNQLWRFVPQDAALSYDLVSGNEASEERFMSELKAFLEKEVALLTVTPSSDQVGLLLQEGLVLKKRVQKISNISIEVAGPESMEIDGENQSNKRRKLPDGISMGVELLQNGLKVISNSLTQWQPNHVDSTELHNKFMTHFSCLEEVIANLVGLSNVN